MSDNYLSENQTKTHYYLFGSHCLSWRYSSEDWMADGKPLPWFCIVTHYDEADGFEIKIGKLMIGFI